MEALRITEAIAINHCHESDPIDTYLYKAKMHTLSSYSSLFAPLDGILLQVSKLYVVFAYD